MKQLKTGISFVSALLFVLGMVGYGMASPPSNEEIRQKAGQIRVPFIANEGQAHGDVVFYAKTFSGTVFVTKQGELVYSLPKREEAETKVKTKRLPEGKEIKDKEGVALKERLIGAKVREIKGEGKAQTKVSYFIGKDQAKWKSEIATYDVVNLGEVYEGIELKLRAYGNNVEKLYYVQPEAEPSGIQMKVEGAKALRVTDKGELEAETVLGAVSFTRPIAYQKIGGKRVDVAVDYSIRSESDGVGSGLVYGFQVEGYDRTKELVIDPLLASTFIGGTSSDSAFALAIDGSGNIYITGGTGSSNYPTTPGAYDRSINLNGYSGDVFISKLDSDLASLLASTFIGGSGDMDAAQALAIDGSGNVYITGITSSSDYPTTPSAYDRSFNGGEFDVFVSKLDSDLASLLASTFIGGGQGEYSVGAIAIDASGNIYISGSTQSPDYPTTTGAYDTAFNGSADVFVSKLDSDLASLLASTFIGGSVDDNGEALAIAASGNVYISGTTFSSDYPTTPGAYDTTHNGRGDVFVSKLDSDLASLLASTFIGGSGGDYFAILAIDASGNICITGQTFSSNYPTTPGAYDTTHNGNGDVFVSKLDSDLASLLASTFIGGSTIEDVNALAVDGSGNVYITGETYSSDYPTTPGAYNRSHKGYPRDVFVSKLDSELTTLLASTFIGGTGNEYAYGLAIDGSGNVYITGNTDSSDYPATTGAYDTLLNGISDVFVSKFSPDLKGEPLPATPPTLGTLTPQQVITVPGTQQTFSAVYSDANGHEDLKIVYLKVSPGTLNNINVLYYRDVNRLMLLNDAGTAYIGPCKPGVAGTLTNSQGTVDCGATTVTGAGNNLTVNWNITPAAAFASPKAKNLYMYATDMSNAAVGWIYKGKWTITNDPTLGSLTPQRVNTAPGVPQTFSAVYSDPNGYEDLKTVYLKVSPGTLNNINVLYYRDVNRLLLLNDAGTAYIGPCTPGVAGTLTNSQGTLDCGATTVTGAGNNLTVNWSITPSAAFASSRAKDLYMYASDMSNAAVGWAYKGEWTISP